MSRRKHNLEYLSDVIEARRIACMEEEARWKAEDVACARIASILRDNPGIGELARDGQRVFYIFPAGGKYREAKDPAKLIAAAGATL